MSAPARRWLIIGLVIVGGVVAVKWLAGKLGGVLNLGDLRVGLWNWVVVGLMAVTFIVVAKIVTIRWQVPGLTQAMQAV